jgi:hypothetical protein
MEIPMTSTIKAGLLATTMAAVALVPAASVVTLATVDAAYANNGNGNGGGNGNGNGGGGGGERGNGGSEARGGQSEARGGKGEARGGGRPEWAGGQRNGGENGNRGGGRSESARGGSDPISNFIRNLTGEERREARAQARSEARAARQAPTEYAPEASIAPGKRPARNSDMHPSELGNMNGALNANINAVLAHIRNGNTNGPVGGLAALAVADAEYAAFVDTNDVLEQEAVAALLKENDYDSIQAYYDALETDPEAKEIPALDEAIATLGENANVEDPVDTWRPDTQTVTDARTELEELEAARLAAEGNMLSLWNKNGDANPDELTPEEEALLDDLRGRLVSYETDIEQAVIDRESGVIPEDPETDEDEASCEGLVGCESPEDGEDLAAVE